MAIVTAITLYTTEERSMFEKSRPGFAPKENWIVCALGLNETKKGLQGYVFDVFSKGLSKKTPLDREEIRRLHRNGSPAFENITDNDTCGIWMSIKCFLPKTGYRNVQSFEDLDVRGLLSLIITCTLFDETVTVDLNSPNIFSDLESILIEVFHTPSRDITERELRCYLEKMIELLTDAKAIKNKTEAIEAVKQITQLQMLCNRYDVKHRPPELSSVHESETSDTLGNIKESEECKPNFANTRASGIESGLCDEKNHLAEADSVLKDNSCSQFNPDFSNMTALLKTSSEPEDSKESFHSERPDSKEEAVEEMPKPDYLQAYRPVAGTNDKCSLSEDLLDLPVPNGIWANTRTTNPGSKTAAEQSKNCQLIEQTLTEISSTCEETCQELVFVSCGTKQETVEAIEATNPPLFETIKPLDNLPDPEPSSLEQSEFDKERCEKNGKTVLVETRNQDFRKAERISGKHQEDKGKHLDITDKHLDDTDKYVHDTDKYLDDTGRHLNDIGKHLDDTDKHLDDTDKHLDDTGKHLDDTGKYRDDTGKHLDNTGKPVDSTDKHLDNADTDLDDKEKHLDYLDNTEKHLENTGKDLSSTLEHLYDIICRNDVAKQLYDSWKHLEYTDKHKDDTDKNTRKNSHKLSKSEAEIEAFNASLDGNDTVYGSLTKKFREDLQNCKSEERKRNVNEDSENSESILANGMGMTVYEDALQERARNEIIELTENADCTWYTKYKRDMEVNWDWLDFSYMCEEFFQPTIEDIIDCLSVHRLHSILFWKCSAWTSVYTYRLEEEKQSSFETESRHAVENRWARFEGEPEIRVKQNLKKWREVTFGTASRQGYLGSSDKPDEKLEGGKGQQACGGRISSLMTALWFLPAIDFTCLSNCSKTINSKLITAFVFVLLFCSSHAEVKGNRMQTWKEGSVAISCPLSNNCTKGPWSVKLKVGPNPQVMVVTTVHIIVVMDNEERTAAVARERVMPFRQAVNSDQNSKQKLVSSLKTKTNDFVYQESVESGGVKSQGGAQRQGISSDHTSPRINRKEQHCGAQSTVTAQANDFEYQEESQELAAFNVQNLGLETGVGDNSSLNLYKLGETNISSEAFLLYDSYVEEDFTISEEESDLQFQYHMYYGCTKNNFTPPTYFELCDAGEIHITLIAGLSVFVIFLVGIAYFILARKGDEDSYWVTKACLIPCVLAISCFALIILMFRMRHNVKQEVVDHDHDDVGDVADSKSILTEGIKCICIAVVIFLVLSLLVGFCIAAIQILPVEQCSIKQRQIDGYYEERNQNYDTGIKKRIICSEQGELTRSRKSCRYCEGENEQQLEEYVCLVNKPQIITYDDIEHERQSQQNLTTAENLYIENSEEYLKDGKPLAVDEKEVLVHEFSRIKPFVCSEEEDFLSGSDTDQELEDLEIEEIQEKKNESGSEDADNREWALKGNRIEQVEDCVKKVCKETPGRECNGGREVQSTSDECGTDICGADSFDKKDGFCVFEEIDEDVCIGIPPIGASNVVPLENANTGNCNRAPEATASKKSKLRLQVYPNQLLQDSRQYSDAAVEKKNPKFAFQNLNYKVKVESQSTKEIDSAFTEEDFGKYLEIRGFTWLPINQLPAPKLDPVSVAFVQNFEPLMVIIDQIANGTPPTPHVSMRYELLRFCTLRSYPKENKPYLIKLAEAGFYYASDSDGVVCYCCGIRRYNWVAKDDPMKVHQRINPDCKYLKKNEEVNVPVKYFGPYSEKLMYIMSIPEPVERPHVSEDVNNDWAPERIRSPAPAQQSSQNETGTNALGINTAIPKHPVYATKTTREASYNGWSDSSSHTPQELSDAGFFYAGFGDCVRCFYCGIGLRHWTTDDNPWIEHARWSRNCVYLRQKKGEEFVNLVQLALQYSQDNESQANEASGNASATQDVEKILLSNAAQSVLEMGYQPRMIKKAIEEILRQNRNAKIVAQTLMEKLLEIEEAEETVQTAQAPAAADKTAPAKQIVKPKRSESFEGTKVSGASNTEGYSRSKDSGSIKAKSQTNDTSEGNKVTLNELEKNDSKSLDPKTIKAENELLKEQTLCKVCLDNTVCIVFLPCGHLVTCADCAPAMRKCPICRALVKGTVRTYMS